MSEAAQRELANAARAGKTGIVIIAATRLATFIETVGSAHGMTALGVSVAGFSFGARLEYAPLWGHDEFFGALGFGALLAILGSAERLIGARDRNPPVS